MTGTMLSVPDGVSFADIADGFDTAVPRGLTYFNLFDSTARLGANLAEDVAIQPTINGAPTSDGVFMTADKDNKITTNIAQPAGSFTMFAVATVGSVANAFLLGNYMGAAAGGVWLYFLAQSGNVRIDYGSIMDNAGDLSISLLSGPNVVVGSTHSLCIRYDAATRKKTLDVLGAAGGAGLRYTNTPAYPMAVHASNKLIVGATPSSAIASSSKVALAAIHDVLLTDAEVAQAYQQIKGIMAEDGVYV
ncbi:hypothetical protein E0K93_09615 [Puniceibacterium sp. HSS470]|nr:hypothetical protein E0K93_09615 [Puniceibacterium sp. HSS470]|tara:strand:+ start:950 stop:1693 length:744 start_codon:yes stop_codon:yes gene_type:complete